MNAKFVVVEVLCLILSLSSLLLIKIDNKQPKPYMDEEFHIPQVQKYCAGTFDEWDPMITTLPGLYVVTVGVLKPISWLFGVPMKTACSTFWLRSINVAFTVGNFIVLLLLVFRIHSHRKGFDENRAVAIAVALCILPVMYFFAFLYYTDMGSTFFVLLMYLLSLYGNHTAGAVAGGIAVMFRQTNIVWAAFVVALSAERQVIDFVQPKKKELTAEAQGSSQFFITVLKVLLNTARTDPRRLRELIASILKETWTYLLLGITFVLFIWINGGIVVGARDMHQAHLHFPQIFYFASFTAGFSSMYILSVRNITAFIRLLRKPHVLLASGLLCYLLVWKFTIEHKYLLADNRHFTFYVWHKVYRRHELVKFILIPGYMFALYSIMNTLMENAIWKLIYIGSVCLILVPSPLLEFRYFIIPYLLFRLHVPLASVRKLMLEIVLYVLVNGVTLYLFMMKPFYWPSSSAKQRFMW